MSKHSENSRIRLRVHGRVQGVYFRASTVREAQGLGLTGWVMNCPDGTVAVTAEGRREKLEQLIAWCRHGPDGARVSQVAIEWQAAEGDFRSFEIRR